MPEHVDAPVGRRPHGRKLTIGALAASVLFLSGCSGQLKDGFLPEPVTDGGQRVVDLWNASWITLLIVGAITWGLMLYAAVRYKRRKGDDGLPVQLRYNVPIEMLYTIIPVFMVAVYFVYTARDEAALTDTSVKPDVTISVVAKQWSWDFNYVDDNVHTSGVHTQLDGTEGKRETMPVLVLPQGKRVTFVLNSRDVIHSFWVPAFLQKLDMLPGQTNSFQVQTTQVGEFQGKCAELCGAFHSEMLFMVKIVPENEYNAHIAKLKADPNSQGLIPVDASREQMVPHDATKIPAPALTGSN